MLTPDERIYVAGHRGMVGSAIVRLLRNKGFDNIVIRSHAELDLTDQAAVREFFHTEKVDRVVLAAAKVGGIYANNTYPAEFIYDNLAIQCNIIHEAYCAGVGHLLFLGSSCIYPRICPQPMKEEHLLSGLLEPTNEPYAIAKIAGIKMCESYNRQYGTSYRSVMPTNLYGPGDNYHLENSHVIPALFRKYHLAKLAAEKNLEAIVQDEKAYGSIPAEIGNAIGYSRKTRTLDSSVTPKVILWGTGSPRREFLHVEDMASGCLHVMGLDESYFAGDKPSFLNIGAGSDITIRETAAIIADIVGFTGSTIYNPEKPDGNPQKLLDISRMTDLGWSPRYSLRDGLEHAYRAYLQG